MKTDLIKYLSALLLMLFAATASALVDESELLDPDDAFAIEVRALSRDLLEVHWQIAPGYYMYRHRINFRAGDEAVELGEPQLPDGKRYVDEFFGEVETYRDSLTVRVPITVLPAGMDRIELKARSQGCADVGVCYPPHQQIIPVALPAGEVAGFSGAANGAVNGGSDAGQAGDGMPAGGGLQQALSGFGNGPQGLTDDATEALPEEQAFMVEAINLDAGTLLARLTPAPGYYIYQRRQYHC